MSVQAGIWNFDGKPVDPKLTADFFEALKQQGPDGEFLHLDGSIALLYRPFHTTAESRREKQPSTTRRGFILTWDGRLDNREELIIEAHDDLDAHPTDVAIVGAAFDRWGKNCFRRIIGDWAVSIWDHKNSALVLATDYMAVRHIFYYKTTDRILWSTDLASLVLLSGDKFHIDDNFVAGYFAQYPDAHLTPYREIYEVPPGHFVEVRHRSTSVERFWRFSSGSRIRYKTDAEYEEHFLHVFRQSVSRRLRSDSPILAELSGGIDSSSIVCMADDIAARGVAGTPVLDTLSYYDRTEPNGDDWIYFPKVEEKRGRIGHHIDGSTIVRTATALNCPEFSALPGGLGWGRELETQRAELILGGGHRVVLSGVGGDEFMGAVPNPSGQLADLIVTFKWISLVGQLVSWSLLKRKPWTHLLGQACLNLLPHSLVRQVSEHTKPELWIQRSFARRTRLSAKLLGPEETFGLSLPTRRLGIAGVLLMASKLAKATPPAQALEETRYPYLDQDFIEFILSIPATQLLRPGERRSLMRRALINIVPLQILSRKTKQFGARTPVVALERAIPQIHALFDCSLSSGFGYIDDPSFLGGFHAAVSGKEVHIVHMMRTIALELWLRNITERRLLEPPPASRGSGPAISLKAVA